jgi:hypothetical protein
VTRALVWANYRCTRPADFAIHSWPDGVVVYDDASGSLQALSPIAGEAFALIRAKECSPESLARSMELAEPGPDDIEMFQSLLMQFESMGLIECIQG